MTQQQEYYSIVTNNGLIKEALASAPNGSPINLTHIAVGDSNGNPYNPTGGEISLVHELYRTTLTHVTIDQSNPKQLIVEGVINEEVGPFYINEVGIFDANGDLFAIGKYPQTFKPNLPSGSGKRLYIRMILGFANNPQVNLVISEDINNDPNFSANVNAALAGKLVKNENLADLENASEARENLGLGSAALAGDASEEEAGIVIIAGQEEVNQKTDDKKVVTAKTLANFDLVKRFDSKLSAISVDKLASSRSSRQAMAVIMKDGNIKIWGRGANYGVTDPNGNDQYQPILLSVDPDYPPTSKFVQVEFGPYCGFALDADGRVYSWGYNGYGQLGHGDTVNRRYAKRIEHFVANDIRIAKIITNNEMGYNDASTVMFIGTNGYVYGCGDNHEGVLGDGTLINRYIPIRIGALTNVVQVVLTCGNAGTAYFRTDNGATKELYVTGYNTHGQLGVGHTNRVVTPTKINTYNNITHIAAYGGVNVPGTATYGSAIFINNGKVYTAGFNEFGQLGQGHNSNLSSWSEVPNLTGIIDAGMVGSPYDTAYVINSSGQILLCGYNAYGQLGRGHTTNSSTFALPVGGDLQFQGKIKKVLLPGDKSCNGVLVLDNDGQVYGCGYGNYGTLSQGDYSVSIHANFKKAINSKNAGEKRKCIDLGCTGWYYIYSVFLLYDDGTLRTAGNNDYGVQGHAPATTPDYKVYSDVVF
jgi:alpha-tubulin suppressor-like RCC1 family protein